MYKPLKTLGMAAVASLMCATQAFASPYDAYKGTTLVVNFPAHPHYNAVMKILPEFTKETGIEVEVDQLPYLKMRERQTLELGQDEGDYDLDFDAGFLGEFRQNLHHRVVMRVGGKIDN